MIKGPLESTTWLVWFLCFLAHYQHFLKIVGLFSSTKTCELA